MMVQQKESLSVLIMAGGTGGHIFPGIALADELKKRDYTVSWLGASGGMECQIVPKNDIILYEVSVTAIRGKRIVGRALAVLGMVRAVYQAWKLLRKIKPDVVVGMGGYAAAPGAVAAKMMRIPVVIHEQNAIAGYTNRTLAKHVHTALMGFPDAFAKLPNAKYVGNPVRKELWKEQGAAQEISERTGPIRVLVFGGSRGAKALNDNVPAALGKLNSPVEVWHQSGQDMWGETIEAYQALGIEAKVVPFIHEMAEAYAWADFVICRGGALTIAELTVVGLPSLIVPYPFAVDDHQTANAKLLVEKGAALLISQQTLTPDSLAEKLKTLLDRANLVKMADGAYQQRRENVVENIVDVCLLAKQGGSNRNTSSKAQLC